MVHFQSKIVLQFSAGYIANNTFLQIVTLDSTDVYRIHYKCLESPKIFVEIPQKLEASNRTIRRSQVFLRF
jgi:hypothetical protein